MSTGDTGGRETAGESPDSNVSSAPSAAGSAAETPVERADEDAPPPEEVPVTVGSYTWETYKREFYYDSDGNPPRSDDGEVIPFDRAAALGFDSGTIEDWLGAAGAAAESIEAVVDERTVDVQSSIDEDQFFTDEEGISTITNRYDLEKAVPMEKKRHFEEIERYWVNEPYAFVIIFRSRKENEVKYYVVEPYQNEIEQEVTEYVTGKLRTAIKYGEQGTTAGDRSNKREVITEEAYRLLDRYDIAEETNLPLGNRIAESLDGVFSMLDRGNDADRDDVGPDDPDSYDSASRSDTDAPGDGLFGRLLRRLGYEITEVTPGPDGIAARPEPVVLEEDPETLTEYQIEKLLYYLRRDFIGYERIDGIKHDINVEDISCDGYDSPVFVYHTEYEQIITNIVHGREELDDFVVKLAQRSGKGISKRRPQVDATLPDGSRAQLTLGEEVSDHGTNYTIRQFKDVPFTPIDLVNWHTFSLDEMAYLWVCIENGKSVLFAGGTASGKTTSLNAVSLFIPSNTKIVSIEDTREVELPQRNWIASVTRPSFTEDGKGDVDEFDLLEAALRQRPDYIVMGEVRGEEGRTLFQVMSTGHTTYTTFHADTVGEVLKRFTTDPINVSKTMFTALDLVSIQTSTRVQGRKVRRNKSLTEINHYDAENDEINVQDVFQWQAESDEFLRMGTSNTMEKIQFDRGWTRQELRDEEFKRKVVLAYLIDRELNTYTQVAATLQAFMNDPETILTLMANDELEASLEDLREMESVLIDIDPEVEALVPRPEPGDRQRKAAREVLERAEAEIFQEYRGRAAGSLAAILDDVESSSDVVADPGETAADADVATANGGVDDLDGDDSPESGSSEGFDGGDSLGFGSDDDRGGDDRADEGDDDVDDGPAEDTDRAIESADSGDWIADEIDRDDGSVDEPGEEEADRGREAVDERPVDETREEPTGRDEVDGEFVFDSPTGSESTNFDGDPPEDEGRSGETDERPGATDRWPRGSDAWSRTPDTGSDKTDDVAESPFDVYLDDATDESTDDPDEQATPDDSDDDDRSDDSSDDDSWGLYR